MLVYEQKCGERQEKWAAASNLRRQSRAGSGIQIWLYNFQVKFIYVVLFFLGSDLSSRKSTSLISWHLRMLKTLKFRRTLIHLRPFNTGTILSSWLKERRTFRGFDFSGVPTNKRRALPPRWSNLRP